MVAKKTVVTITGIRPDFIRMSEVFKRLDQSSKLDHILVHSGQHFDPMLSDVFFEDLQIRKPDFNLGIGGKGKEHFHQLGEISVGAIELLRTHHIDPSLILFLGDSNSVAVSMVLKKEGYEIGHIEAGMRSGDKRMLEEINRIVCDHCSTYHFVYHQDYAANLTRENLPEHSIYNVGNTVMEVCRPIAESLFQTKKEGNYILMDIHRPENFKHPARLYWIHDFALRCQKKFGVPVKLMQFSRAIQAMEAAGIRTSDFEPAGLMSYRAFLSYQYHSLFMISDSGTAQEEPALLNTPVIVPREFTERPQSEQNGCSYRVLFRSEKSEDEACRWVDSYIHGCVQHNSAWLGDGHAAENIVRILENVL